MAGYGKYEHSTKRETINIVHQKVTPDAYIEFLSRTDLGKQYPKERFNERITKLVNNTQISLIAYNTHNEIVAICFGITDFAYWLMITDLGVDRAYVKNGIGSKLLKIAREEAGGEKDIIVFINANDDAIPFYEKCGLQKSKSMMELSDIEWTQFEVKKGDTKLTFKESTILP
ncbi:MAG: GNAT family N-acetyltransferase [Fibrobacter sp.]|nr:GNAT family N-acetyltransferase [Fibrobacter sp.]